MPPKDLYEEMCKYYSFQTGPIPAKERLKEGLRQTVTPEELQVFFLMPFAGSMPFEKIARKAARLGLTPEETRTRLDRLHQEAFAVRYHTEKGLSYERGFSAYMAEQQVRMRQGTELGQIYAQFWFDLSDQSARNLPTKTPYFRVLAVETTVVEPTVTEEGALRTIDVDQHIDDPRQVLPIDILSEMIRQEPLIAVSECYCRLSNKLIGNECHLPMETCFTFNELAESLIDIGTARKVDADEAIEILKGCEEAGLVHNADNCAEHLKALCNCCACHCPAMFAHQRGQKNIGAPSRFIAQYSAERCTLCQTCISRCPVEVITLAGETLHFNLERCIGCGLCVSTCPEDAIRMDLREKAPRIEKDNDALWGKIRREAMVGMVLGKLTGKK